MSTSKCKWHYGKEVNIAQDVGLDGCVWVVGGVAKRKTNQTETLCKKNFSVGMLVWKAKY